MNENELLRAILGLCQQWVTNTSGSPPVNLTLPLIDNQLPQLGETLYVTDGTWSEAVTITYEWQKFTAIWEPANGANTSSSYTVQVGTSGLALRCEITATGVGGSTVADSAATGDVDAVNACVLKLYADNISGVVTDPVATWPDKSGNANDPAQASGISKPTLALGTNGFLAVAFNGSSQFMTTGSALFPTDSTTLATVFAVIVPASDATDARRFLGNNAGNNLYMMGLVRNTDAGVNIPAALASKEGVGSQFAESLSAVAAGSMAVLTGKWDGTHVHLYLNGVFQNSTAFNATTIGATQSTNPWTIGCELFAGSGFFFYNGQVEAALVFTGALSNANRQNVENYLLAKYSEPPRHIIATDAAFKVDGNWTDFDDGTYHHVVLGNAPYYSIRFKAAAVEIAAYIDARVATYDVFEDGVYLTTITGSGASGHERVTFTPTNNSTHTFEIFLTSDTSNTQWVYIQAYDATGGDGMGTAPASRNQIWYLGDSIVRGHNAIDESAYGYVRLVSSSLPEGCFDGGISGYYCADLDTSLTGATLPANCSRVIVCIGVNDATLGNDPGSGAAASYASIISKIQALAPALPKYFLGLIPYPTPTNRASFNTMISNAVAAASDATCHYVNTDGWIAVPGDIASGVHPNATGHAKIATALETVL